MIVCHMLDGESTEITLESFAPAIDVIEPRRRILEAMPIDVVIDLLHRLSRRVVANPETAAVPGMSYLALWLRRENLERVCAVNYGDRSVLDRFCPSPGGFRLMARPRGIVALWIAANVPTLGLFAIVQVLLSKNGAIVKIPQEYRLFVTAALGELAALSTEHNGVAYSGQELAGSIALVSFPGRHEATSRALSLSADCRVLFGGGEAVRAIHALPVREHCETIVFGPKYSFGVFDCAFIEGDGFDEALRKTAQDVAVFDQLACSSPHVLFFEKSRFSLEEVGTRLHRAFSDLPAAMLRPIADHGTLAAHINERAAHLMMDGGFVRAPDDLCWSVLGDRVLQLEEPVTGRCVYVKEVEALKDVLPLITRKVQAVSVGILDSNRREAFAREASYRGVDRIVAPGTIHDYTLPWDGVLTLNRLVRWVVLRD